NGTKDVQLTVTIARMIKFLSAASGPVDVVSEVDDTSYVKFRVVDDLSHPVNMEMHIVVAELYDTSHTARPFFNVSGLDTAGSSATNDDSDDEAASAGGSDSGKTEENPPTGDNSQLALYAVLLLASVGGIFVIWKSRTARN